MWHVAEEQPTEDDGPQQERILQRGNGGGIGNPADRDPASVASDVKNGYLTAHHARKVYGYAGE